MIPRLSSNDLQFWETMYSSGVPVASSRSGLGIAYWERIGSAVTFEKIRSFSAMTRYPTGFMSSKAALSLRMRSRQTAMSLFTTSSIKTP